MDVEEGRGREKGTSEGRKTEHLKRERRKRR